MKILRTRLAHYLEVVFPQLILQYGWKYTSENNIMSKILRYFNIPFKDTMLHYKMYLTRKDVSVKNLKKILRFCELLIQVPNKFNQIFSEMLLLPFSTIRSICLS